MKKTTEDNYGGEIEPAVETGSVEEVKGHLFSKDEYQLARLGYKQEFFRSLGLFENWTATFTSMNFVSGIPGKSNSSVF